MLLKNSIKKARPTHGWFEELEARYFFSAASVDVALIDTSLPNYSALSSAISDQTRLIAFNGKTDSANKVLGKLAAWAATSGNTIRSVAILSHGSSGRFALGKEWISTDNAHDPAWQRIRRVMDD